MKKVVVFGAGMVAGAHVEYLLDHGLEVTVASRTLSKAQELVRGHAHGHAVAVNSDDHAAMEGIIRQHDLAVSLLPYAYHPEVAKLCIKHGVHMVTTSYIKQAMADLDQDAKNAGVILLNEIGVDPGIDHMTAMRVINKVQGEGGKITKFISFCGGLPAPEANTNPFGYKFSWSPRGVLLAGKNPAHYLWDGEEVDIKAGTLFDHFWTMPVEVEGKVIEYEGYPNRDSLPYMDAYGIQGAKTMFRGTLRNLGWCTTLSKISDLGLLDEAPREDLAGLTWAEFTRKLVGDRGGSTGDGGDLKADLAAKLGLDVNAKPVTDLEWLSVFSDEPLPAGQKAPIDILCARMLEKMQYAPGERDMLILRHEFEAGYPDRTEKITSVMVDFGIPNGYTSMARTVGLPAAIGVRLILEDKVNLTGVVAPVMPEIYEPVLNELEDQGIHFVEKWEELAKA
jgi:saccharopine dehydrogenase-like NADP-dependent oxidoreductase